MYKINKNVENLKKLTWEEYYKIPLQKKLGYYVKDNHLFDCLFSQQLNRKLIVYQRHSNRRPGTKPRSDGNS